MDRSLNLVNLALGSKTLCELQPDGTLILIESSAETNNANTTLVSEGKFNPSSCIHVRIY